MKPTRVINHSGQLYPPPHPTPLAPPPPPPPQVGSYRVIVSFETPQLEEFSLCILQQNNCFGCDANILESPRVPLMRRWRGAPIDAAASRQIMIGHFDCDEASGASQRLPWSWKIVCGANPAYDAFPAQHQIFYPSEKSATSLWCDRYNTLPLTSPSNLPTPNHSSLTLPRPASSRAPPPPPPPPRTPPLLRYDPVFKVETLDGRSVWTKRHYRCTPRTVPSDLQGEDGSSAGAWTLSTLDNGVISKEHWTIVDAADDLSWAVLHYSGAAAVVGQSYLGALLCSADGSWPARARTGAEYERIEGAFRKCGIALWELYGHGPAADANSFMWTEEHHKWEATHPPPLDPIGDQTVQAWRASEKAKGAAQPA